MLQGGADLTSLALSQTSAKAAGPWTWMGLVHSVVCLITPKFCWYSLTNPTEMQAKLALVHSSFWQDSDP